MSITAYAKEHPYFLTVTCLEWKHVLLEDRFKDIVMESLGYLSETRQACVYAFVPMAIGMSNHFHLIWQMLAEHKRNSVQRDLLKYTSQQILKHLRNENSILLDELLVNSKDRKHQLWERNSLSVPLWSEGVFLQKLEYIHHNPVRAGLCKHPEEYKYSSASFYELNARSWDFLVHYEG
jgi:putative transposase